MTTSRSKRVHRAALAAVVATAAALTSAHARAAPPARLPYTADAPPPPGYRVARVNPHPPARIAGVLGLGLGLSGALVLASVPFFEGHGDRTAGERASARGPLVGVVLALAGTGLASGTIAAAGVLCLDRELAFVRDVTAAHPARAAMGSARPSVMIAPIANGTAKGLALLGRF